jgi:site-specific DNA-cytosine methylase
MAAAPADLGAVARPLLVATDCSGLGSPLLAMRRMGVRFHHLWASDIDKDARKMIREHGPPDRLYRSIYDHEREQLPTPDVYIVGFPCQPFSGAGHRQGLSSPEGQIFFRVLEVIEQTRPRVFILENVSGMETTRNGDCVRQILRCLYDLGTHNIYHQLMNTKDHGVPQNRPRLYFVGILHQHDQGTFVFPPMIPLRDIRGFLDTRDRRPSYAELPPPSASTARNNVLHFLHQFDAQGKDPFFEPWVIECDASRDFAKAMLGVASHVPDAKGIGCRLWAGALMWRRPCGCMASMVISILWFLSVRCGCCLGIP